MDIGRAIKRLFVGKSEEEKTESRETGGRIRRINRITIVAVADLHLCFQEDMEKIVGVLEKGRYDCVLLLGDIYPRDARNITSHAGGKPCLYVAGNHDEWGQNEEIPGLECIDGITAEVGGVRISGAGGGPRYKDGPYVMRSEEEMRAVLSGIGRTDILATHESPYHLLNTNRAHSGFSAISDFIVREHVPLHIFGHHHIDHVETRGATREVCIYGCSVITTDPFSIRKIL